MEGEGVGSERVTQRWFRSFNTGEVNTKDLTRSGRPKLWDIENIRTVLEENPQKCTHRLSEELGASKDTTEWKGNKCHPFNSRRGRLKESKNLYTIWESKLDSFLRKRCFLFCFVHVVLLISLEIMQYIYISVSLSYKDVILFSKIFYVIDVVYVKLNSIL